EAIPVAKDVDGFHPENAGRLALGLAGFVPCTPLGIRALLAHYDIPLAGRRVTVVGRSAVAGRPLAQLLSQRGIDATGTLARSRRCPAASGRSRWRSCSRTRSTRPSAPRGWRSGENVVRCASETAADPGDGERGPRRLPGRAQPQ